MKTLFLKSNILYIRTNEGEFEVSNPEVIPSKMKNYADAPEGLFSPVEWPYSYELIDKPNGYPDELCARLITEEKKKPVFIPEDHLFASTGRASKFYETKTESAYKEFEAFFSEFQERYAFQVPYDGTNEFYNQKKLDQAESFKMDMKFAWDKIFTRKPE